MRYNVRKTTNFKKKVVFVRKYNSRRCCFFMFFMKIYVYTVRCYVYSLASPLTKASKKAAVIFLKKKKNNNNNSNVIILTPTKNSISKAEFRQMLLR